MTNLLKKTIKFVDDSFGEKSRHFDRTAYWIKQLKPNADEAMLIAAYAHDIERAKSKRGRRVFLNDEEFKTHHEKGAEIIYHFLIDSGADKKIADRVKHLVSKHEIGGDNDQNILMDADSISYFETNAIRHAGWIEEFGKEPIEQKFNFMYGRISSEKAKRFAEPFYKKAIATLKDK